MYRNGKTLERELCFENVGGLRSESRALIFRRGNSRVTAGTRGYGHKWCRAIPSPMESIRARRPPTRKIAGLTDLVRFGLSSRMYGKRSKIFLKPNCVIPRKNAQLHYILNANLKLAVKRFYNQQQSHPAQHLN